jgi:hypothetical protein
MVDVSGATGAAPIFAAILRAVATRHTPGPLPVDLDAAAGRGEPESLGLERVEVCPLSGSLRTAACPRGVREWLPHASERRHCDWHQHVAIDVRNGLLAGPACPNGVVDAQNVEVLPKEFTQWAHATGRPRPPLGSSPHCPLPTGTATVSDVQISSPSDGARFVLDPDRPRELQRLQIVVAAGGPQGRPRLEIDGERPRELDGSLRFDWTLQPGDHVFIAIGEDGERSVPVRVSVREAI